MKKKLLSVLLATVLLLTMLPVGVTSVSAATYNGLTYEIVDGEVTITGYTDELPADLVIPATIEDYPVTKIGDYAFDDCDKLLYVDIPDSVTVMGKYVFYDCDSLISVSIPDSITAIEDYTFTHCGALTSVTIPDSVISIGYGAFGSCWDLVSVTIGNGVTSIGEAAFMKCCCLEKIVIPDSVTTIGWGAFAAAISLETIIIPNGVTIIEEDVFCGCTALKSIVIPDGVTSIGCIAFSGCESLTSVTIPGSVTTIEEGAFSGCAVLDNVYYDGTEEEYSDLSIGVDNESLNNATWHYNCINPKDHYDSKVAHSVMDTDQGNGLAYRFNLSVKIGIKEKNKADYANATINYLGKIHKLLGIGSVITNSDTIGNSDFTLDMVDGRSVVDIPTVYLQELDEESCAFATRIINIPDSARHRTIYARPYYVVEVDGEQITIYGDVNAASCTEYL